jgi:hypothetical protein
MVENFKKILDTLKADNRPVWLFAYLKMDDLIDKWSLIISAPWINANNENDEYKNILNIVKSCITDEESSSIARVVILPKDDHLIEELLKKEPTAEIKDEKINGNIIHSGFIVESNPDLVTIENKTLFDG